jgi:two-component system sensor kinase FixL
MEPPARPKSLSLRRRKPEPVPAAGARGGAWALDPSGELDLSPGARALLTGEGDFAERLPIDESGRLKVRAALSDGGDFDLKLRRQDGRAPAALRLTGGAVGRGLVGTLVETDDEERLAQELAARGAHVRSILETALDGMVVIDERGRIQSFNTSAQRMFGYSEAEAIGRNVSMLMAEPDRTRHDTYMERYMSTDERRIIGIGRIVTGERKDGAQFPLHLSVGEVHVEGRRLFTSFMHDLTEERRSESRTQALQAELAHISRLSALGEMGSALAHELNQPLAAIGNYITGSRRLISDVQGPAAAKIESALARAAEQVLRAGQIIRRLRDFVSRRTS